MSILVIIRSLTPALAIPFVTPLCRPSPLFKYIQPVRQGSLVASADPSAAAEVNENTDTFANSCKGSENVDSAPLGGGDSVFVEPEETQEMGLGECTWLENLAEDPYYRGVQDQARLFLSVCTLRALFL